MARRGAAGWRAAVALVAVALAAQCARLAHAKVFEREVALSSVSSEQNLAKFSFSQGAEAVVHGTWRISERKYGRRGRARNRQQSWVQGRHALKIYLFDDEAFETFNKMTAAGSLCDERMHLASASRVLNVANGNAASGGSSPAGAPPIPEDPNGFTLKLPENRKRSEYWYVIIADCQLEWYDARNLPPLAVRLTFFNDGQHLPADEDGLFAIQAIVLVTMLVVGGMLGAVAINQMVKAGNTVHLLVIVTAAAYALQVASIASELLHLIVYARDGRGLTWSSSWIAADFWSEALENLSELVTIFLLIFLACGWTTTTVGSVAETVMAAVDAPSGRVAPKAGATVKLPGQDKADAAKEATKDLIKAAQKMWREAMEDNVFKRRVSVVAAALRRPYRMMSRVSVGSVAVAGVVFAHVVLTMLGRRLDARDDLFHQFHDHEHWPGHALVLMRVLLWLVFMAGGWATKVRARERRPTRDRKYCPVITKPRVEPPAPRQGRCELQVGLSTGRTRRRHDAVNCSARASVCIGGVRHLIV